MDIVVLITFSNVSRQKFTTFG